MIFLITCLHSKHKDLLFHKYKQKIQKHFLKNLIFINLLVNIPQLLTAIKGQVCLEISK